MLVELSAPPRSGDFAEPELGAGQSAVDVAAAGIHLVPGAAQSVEVRPEDRSVFVGGARDPVIGCHVVVPDDVGGEEVVVITEGANVPSSWNQRRTS